VNNNNEKKKKKKKKKKKDIIKIIRITASRSYGYW